MGQQDVAGVWQRGGGQPGAAARAQARLTPRPPQPGDSLPRGRPAGRACRREGPTAGGAGRAEQGPPGRAQAWALRAARRLGRQPCGGRSVPARSRPAPGQRVAASGLSSWEPRRASSSSGSSSVQCRLTLLRIGGSSSRGTWLGAGGGGRSGRVCSAREFVQGWPR